MSHRITNRKGQTIGYVRDQGLELVVTMGLAVLLLGIAILAIPVIAAVYGIMYTVTGYLIFWEWARSLPLTPFPNLNGVLVLAVTLFGLTLFLRHVRANPVYRVALRGAFDQVIVSLQFLFACTFLLIVVLVPLATCILVLLFGVTWLLDF